MEFQKGFILGLFIPAYLWKFVSGKRGTPENGSGINAPFGYKFNHVPIFSYFPEANLKGYSGIAGLFSNDSRTCKSNRNR